MEKKTETSKPILNRTRRQLLLGAGLTPVVMTLHAAKVMADGSDANFAGGVSGPAPYSAIVRASANVDVNAVPENEYNLYLMLESTPANLINYYGGIGSGSVTASASDVSLTWSVGDYGSIGWANEYENRFFSEANTYMNTTNKGYIKDIYTDADTILAATKGENIIPLEADPAEDLQTKVTTLKKALDTYIANIAKLLPANPSNETTGIYGWNKEIKAILQAAVDEYNKNVDTYNTYGATVSWSLVLKKLSLTISE